MKHTAYKIMAAVLTLVLALGMALSASLAEGAYTLDVQGGSGAGSYDQDVDVPLTAETAPAGKAFSHWSSTNGGMFNDPLSASTTFKMPAANTTVTAHFATPVTFSGLTCADAVYSRTSYAPSGTLAVTYQDAAGQNATPTAEQLPATDIVYTYTGTGTTSYPASTTAPIDVGTYQLVVSIAPSNATFTGASMPIPFSITKAPLTIQGVSAVDRAYNGGVSIALNTSSATLSDVLQGDIVTLDTTTLPTAGTVADGNAATDAKAVTVDGSGITLTGAQAGNYSVTLPAMTATISKYELTAADLSWSGAATRTYDRTPSAVSVTVKPYTDGSVGYRKSGDALDLTVSGGTETNANTYTASVAIAGTSASLSNYTLPESGLTKSYTIDPVVLALSWSGDTARAFDGSDSAVTAVATNLLGPDGDKDVCTVTVSNGTEKNAGAHTASATACSNTNYVLPTDGSEFVSYTITPAIVAISSVSVDPKQFDNAAGGVVNSVAFSGVPGGQTLTLSTDFTATAAFTSTAVGPNIPVTVTVTLTNTNYAFLTDPANPAGGTTQTKDASTQANITAAVLGGTPVINVTTDAGTAGVIDTGDVLEVSLATVTPAGAVGNVSYQWKRNGTDISTATKTQYTVTADDAGQLLTVTITGSGSYSGTLTSEGKRVGARTLTGSISITGTTTSGSTVSATVTLDGGKAVSGTDYSLQWYRGASVIIGATGTSYQLTDADCGQTLTLRATAAAGTSAKYSGTVDGTLVIPAAAPTSFIVDVAPKTQQFTISWNKPTERGAAITGYKLEVLQGSGHVSGSPFTISDPNAVTYTVSSLAGATNYTVTLTALTSAGNTSSSPIIVLVRAPFAGSTPAAPTRQSRTTSKVTLTPHNGYEYSRDGSTWQDSNVFSGLSAGKSYSFYQRVKETSTHEASPTSPKYSCYTLSSSDDSSDDTPTATAKPTATSTPKPADDVLYEIVIADGNTNILFSTMNKLILGNKTRAVAIRLNDAVYTFGQGAMQTQSGKVWYDMGVLLNSGAHHDAIQQLAGDSHVATVHFNYDGDLPGQASIKIKVGTAYAGRTLYYYKYDPAANKLVFQQTALVDVSGWATVTQSSCSDYAFTSADVALTETTPTPSPSPDPAATPTPTATVSVPTAKPSTSGLNWKLIAIIGGIALILLGIIWLLLRRRMADEDRFDDDDEDNAFDEDDDFDRP